MFQYLAPVDNKAEFVYRLTNCTQRNYKVSVKSEDMFFVLLKSTHGGGHYFVGHIAENENKLSVTGEIVHNPDENGNPKSFHYSKKEKAKDYLRIFLGIVLFWWAIIVFAVIALCCKIFAKGKEVTLEEKLDDFMVNHIGCKKLDEPQ